MKGLKMMLLGLMILLVAVWCAAFAGTSGNFLGGLALLLAPVGVIVFLIGFFSKSKES